MNLTHITFTGIDERTDLDRVERISEQHPYVEWGILLSYHWWENGNRYPNPKILDRLEHRGPLGAHGVAVGGVLHILRRHGARHSGWRDAEDV